MLIIGGMKKRNNVYEKASLLMVNPIRLTIIHVLGRAVSSLDPLRHCSHHGDSPHGGFRCT